MEGIEPSSKQGSHMLSTCLFLPSVFVMQQDQDHQLHPYPLKFHQESEASPDYSWFYSTAGQNASGRELSGRCLVPSPSKGIRPIYYTSIKQRERNDFRQLIVWCLILKRGASTLCMLTYHIILLSNPVIPGSIDDTSVCNTGTKLQAFVLVAKYLIGKLSIREFFFVVFVSLDVSWAALGHCCLFDAFSLGAPGPNCCSTSNAAFLWQWLQKAVARKSNSV